MLAVRAAMASASTNRRQIYDALAGVAERWRRPVWWLIHALSAVAAPLSRTIEWAGIRYRVNGPQSVIVERRDRAC